MTEIILSVPIDRIVINKRQRSDFGDIDQLAKSILENGLIQPIILSPIHDFDEGGNPRERCELLVGHRRLKALTKLGLTELTHGVHFLWNVEVIGDNSDKIYRRKAIELEENLRRKSLTWSEEVLAKQELLKIYQDIYGAPTAGAPTKLEQAKLGIKPQGFGIVKLAGLLGEDTMQTSRDLELAALVTKIPSLRKEESREAAKRKIEQTILAIRGLAGPHVAKPLAYKILVECESEQHQQELLTRLRAEGLKCQAIVA